MKVRPAEKRGEVVIKLTGKDEPILGGSSGYCREKVGLRLKKILVPVDFSECSLKALRYALAFAKEFGASLTLLHVVQLHYGGALYGPLDFPVLEEDFRLESGKRLDQIMGEEIGGEVPATTLSKVGRPATEIAKLAREEEIDLIILSTHGYTGLKHVLMGSTAEHVVRHAPCPVLTVREHEHEFVNG